MRHNRWRSFLSYFFDIPIRRWTSGKNGRMKLQLSRGELKLTTDNAVYSFGIHYNSFEYAFRMLGVMNNDSIRTVLVLGWGMGSIADLLEGHPSIRRITGVEHDETLTAAFGELDKDRRSMEIEVRNADAFAFVDGCRDDYDLVCSDVFVDDKTPATVISPAYIRALSRITTARGICLLSKLNQSLADREQNRELEANLTASGIEFGVLNTPGNRIYHWRGGTSGRT